MLITNQLALAPASFIYTTLVISTGAITPCCINSGSIATWRAGRCSPTGSTVLRLPLCVWRWPTSFSNGDQVSFLNT